MRPRGARQTAPRHLFSLITDAVRSVVAPAALVQEQADVTAPDPTDVYTADDMPAVEDIESAAAIYAQAADLARVADRAKRKSRKLLDRLPAGLYGSWLVSGTPSSRQTPDLESIRATYKRLGLGEVPMRTCAPSVKVERVEAPVLAEVA
jgi:hypothetical protein